MKKTEFELFTLIFALLPLVAFFMTIDKFFFIPGVAIIISSALYQFYDRRRDDDFFSMSNELSILAVLTVFSPLLITLTCFHIYTNINDAYWAFMLCCWAFGSALTGFLITKISN